MSLHLGSKQEASMDNLWNVVKQDYETRRHWDAVKKLEAFIQAMPDSAMAYQEIAKNLDALGQYEKAIQACNRALKLDKNLVVPHIILANAYFVAKQYDKSEAEALKALKLDSGLDSAYSVLGSVALKQRQFSRAVRYYKKAVQLRPTRIVHHHNLGLAYEWDDQYAKASREYKHALKLDYSFDTFWKIVLSYYKRYRPWSDLGILIAIPSVFVIPYWLGIPIALLLLIFGLGNVWFSFHTRKFTWGLARLLFWITFAVLYCYECLGLISQLECFHAL